MKTIAYLRVSSEGQDLEKNKFDILQLANEKNFGQVEFVEEKITGTADWRERKIAEVIDICQKGDNLIVPELSRLGRSMLQIMEILSVATTRGINVYAVKGNWQLGNSLQSKILAMAFSMAAEIERDLISQRTKEALAAKKAMGVNLGRPRGPGKSKLDKFKPEIIALLKNGSPKRFIAKRYNTTPANLYNWLQKNKIDVRDEV